MLIFSTGFRVGREGAGSETVVLGWFVVPERSVLSGWSVFSGWSLPVGSVCGSGTRVEEARGFHGGQCIGICLADSSSADLLFRSKLLAGSRGNFRLSTTLSPCTGNGLKRWNSFGFLVGSQGRPGGWKSKVRILKPQSWWFQKLSSDLNKNANKKNQIFFSANFCR